MEYFEPVNQMNIAENTPKYASVQGEVTEIDLFFGENGEAREGYYFIRVKGDGGESVFAVTPDTYYFDCAITVGSHVVGYYLANQPQLLIYPPQYNILVMGKIKEGRNTKVDIFTEDLISSDNTLKLNISDDTWITDRFGRRICTNLADRDLLVLYGPTTRSIPAMTNPFVIIVLS